jgi:choline dehydrogenase
MIFGDNLGNEGWSYDEVMPYFKKAERNENGQVNFMEVMES